MNIWDTLPKPFFVLAPMDDVTDTVFRRVVGLCAAPDLYFTEFVNVDGLQSPGRDKLMHRLAFTKQEGPLIAQIWGKTPENYYKTAQDVVAMGLDGIDINFGCPVKAVVKDGCCAGMINNRELAIEIIQATQEGAASRLPVSVKTRLGFGEIDLTWHELLLKQQLSALTIHGRTKAQMSKVPADWVTIGKIRELRDKLCPKTKIIGNGDVLTRQRGTEMAATYQLDGIMIGRGIFNDPFVFAEQSPWGSFSKQQKMELYQRHIELFEQVWPDNTRRLPVLNKFCKIYINGFGGAKELRDQLMHVASTEEALRILTVKTTI